MRKPLAAIEAAHGARMGARCEDGHTAETKAAKDPGIGLRFPAIPGFQVSA